MEGQNALKAVGCLRLTKMMIVRQRLIDGKRSAAAFAFGVDRLVPQVVHSAGYNRFSLTETVAAASPTNFARVLR